MVVSIVYVQFTAAVFLQSVSPVASELCFNVSVVN